MQLSREQYTYMTDYIKRQYGYSADWCKKVNAMADDQIFAVFCSISARERMKNAQSKPKPVEKAEDHDIYGTQLRWDFKKGVICG